MFNVESLVKPLKSDIGSSEPAVFQVHSRAVSLPTDPGTTNTILDPLKINFRRSKLECPRFDGYDFLGWYMKVEQFFQAVGIPETEKVQMVMIHLDGRALQWHQRYMKT